MYSRAFVLVANFRHFSIYIKSPEQHGQGNFLQNFLKKKYDILRKKVMKSPKIFGGFGWLSSFEIVI
jgi:hypothetical protein